jgi:hypothetical protein
MSKQKSSEIVIIANTIAVALAQDLSSDEENILGNLFALIGASLLSFAALDSSSNSASSDNTKSPDNSTSTDNSNSTKSAKDSAKDSAQTTIFKKS